MPFRVITILLSLLMAFITSHLHGQTAKIDSLHRAIDDVKEDSAKAKIYAQLSKEFWYLSLDTSMMYAMRTLRIAQVEDNVSLEAEAKNNMGVAYWFKGEYPNALRALLAALKLYEQLGDRAAEASTINNIGLVYSAQQKHAEAARQFKNALNIFKAKAPHLQQNIANTYGNLSEALLALHQKDSALIYAFQALEISKSLGSDRNVADHLNAIGNILMQQGKFQTAGQYLEESLHVFDTLKSDWSLAQTYKDLAILADSLHQTNRMIEYAQKSFVIAKKQKAQDVLMASASLLAKGLAQKGQFEEAFKYQKEADYYKDKIFNESKDKELYQLELRQKDKAIDLANKQRALEARESKQKTVIIFSIGGALLLMAVMAGLFFKGREKEKKGNALLLQKNEEIQRKTEEIQEILKSLEAKNEQITRSINAAKTIQQAILPFDSRMKELLKEHFILYRPKDIVSGDFYWIDQVGDKTIVAVADCTGHGVPGAFMSMIGNTLLDEIISIKQMTDPAEILEELNRQIIYSLRQEETHDLNGMDVAIASFKEDKEEGIVEIQFAGAKRPLYYFSTEKKEIVTIKGTARHIGGRQVSTKAFETKLLSLPVGSMIYLTSDGYEDQNNVNRKKVGRLKFLELLKRNAPNPVSIQRNSLTTYLERQMKGVEQRDDIMILGIRL